MFRLDGEVFLLGTAIAAPSTEFWTTIKIATICASSQQGPFWGFPAGGGRIVANRGPYSEIGACCKSGGRQRRVPDERIRCSLVAEGRHRAVAGDEGRLVAHRPQPLGDGGDQLLLVAVRKVPPPDRALEQ